jgi:hypothetical protein
MDVLLFALRSETGHLRSIQTSVTVPRLNTRLTTTLS